MNMKLRYRLFLRRKSVYYAFDDTTKTFTSLKTKDKAEANRLLMAMNEAGKQPAMNLSLARVYLRHSDPMVSVRTWQNVLDEIIGLYFAGFLGDQLDFLRFGRLCFAE